MRALILLLVALPAHSLTITSVDRSVWARAFYLSENPANYTLVFEDATSAPGAWSAEVAGGFGAYAQQQSVANASELSGTGQVAMGVTEEYARTTFDAVFVLEAATAFDFSVDNMEPLAWSLNSASGYVRLDRVDALDPQVLLERLYDVRLGRQTTTAWPDFAAAGVLEAGTYALHWRMIVSGSRHYAEPAPTSFAFTVPEPGTAVLVALGLVVMARARRRGRRRCRLLGRERLLDPELAARRLREIRSAPRYQHPEPLIRFALVGDSFFRTRALRGEGQIERKRVRDCSNRARVTIKRSGVDPCDRPIPNCSQSSVLCSPARCALRRL